MKNQLTDDKVSNGFGVFVVGLLNLIVYGGSLLVLWRMATIEFAVLAVLFVLVMREAQ